MTNALSLEESAYSGCRLCPRKCGADRTGGQTGYCGADDKLRVARAALHYWEEPCLSGEKAPERGSGTVFFSGCSLRCRYCQNRDILSGRVGRVMSAHELADTFLRLQEEGAYNINLVTAAHFLPHIAAALSMVRGNGLQIPVVYNSGGYERVEALRSLEGLIDVYLPDLKYLDSERAKRYSLAPDYPETATAAIAEMVRQTGEPVFDEEGMMQKGVIVRHLALPGGREDSMSVLRYLHDTYADRILVSLMSQYTPVMPEEELADYPELRRRLRRREYDRLVEYAIGLGMENVFIQEGKTAKESFIPPFPQEDGQ